MKKSERHDIIRKVIAENDIENQHQLVACLEKEEVFITQATISRDIRELNIVKNHGENGKSYYRILSDTTKQQVSDEEKLLSVLTQSATAITQVEFINIITTFPGNGQIIGVLIDNLRPTYTKIVACIAGDDTVLVISKNQAEATEVHNHFEQYI